MRCWREPAGGLPYRREAVHVWLAVMPGGWEPRADTLSAAERERAAKFIFERDCTRYLFHHMALRRILSGYTGLPPGDVPFAAASGGKPFLPAPYGCWRFNLSHCGEAAVCAVAHGREVGVDIERVRAMEAAESIAGRFFAPAEREALRGIPEARRDAAFFACWTRKEAFIKATGEGLQRALDSFSVPVDPEECGPWPLPGGWTLTGLPGIPGYACAVAVEGGPAAVETWRFTP